MVVVTWAARTGPLYCFLPKLHKNCLFILHILTWWTRVVFQNHLCVSWHVQTGAAALPLVYIPDANSRKALGAWIDFMGARVKWRHTGDQSFSLCLSLSLSLSCVQAGDRQLIGLVQNTSALEKVCVRARVCTQLLYQ